MIDINWVQVGIGFLSGGAFGALIKQYFDYRKNRIQPIAFHIDLKPFYDTNSSHLVASMIVFKEGAKEYKFETIYTGTLKIKNTGSIDYSDFTLGLTFQDETKFIQFKQTDSNRHHIGTLSSVPSLDNQIEAFDLSLKPFNRKDEYHFDFIVSVADQLFSENSLSVTSPHPVKVKRINEEPDFLSLARKVVFQLGPIKTYIER